MKLTCFRSDLTSRYETSELFLKENRKAEMSLIKVYPNELRQEILGFGGAFTEASAATFATMSEVSKQKFLEAYFGESSHRYNFCRTHIQSCDFSLGNYSYISDENDKGLKSFTIERDQQYLIPLIKSALEINPHIELLASPWSPPAFMKSNGNMNYGGSLMKEYYQMWADTIVRYVMEYQNNGITIQRISVQNEPKATQTWDSCLYSAKEEGEFANLLRKTLDEYGYHNIKIAIWDHNKDCILERACETFTVQGARDSISAVAFHWYTGDHFEALSATHEKFPEKEYIFTEGCVEYSRFKQNNQVMNAEIYLHDIIGNLNQGMNGYIDWNLVLNEQGGPNHVGNYCDAPVMYSKNDDKLDFKLSYYYIGHLSRFVKKGAKRFLVSRYTDKIETVGFVNPNGEKVLVLLNRTDQDMKMQICENNMVSDLVMTAHSVMTICW